MRMTLIFSAVAVAVVLVAWLFASPAHASQPKEGERAPSFSLMDQNGQTHTLADYHGKWLVLYFYPKNDTPGCTTEACNFRDDIFRFREMGVSIVGISLDDVESHQAFAEKYSLPFSLLSDAEKQVSSAYGVLTRMGPLSFARRETFIINPEGGIAKHYGRVNPDTHSAEVLADLTMLMGAGQAVSDAGQP